ncbi:MAG: ABC transporter substrate-binding protein [Betaproteobacteria bacterium]|nr:ABC transporter substrate-binding protein [Betaproteobacteria bacterium]
MRRPCAIDLRRTIAALALGALCLWAVASHAASPRRIVSLAPSLTELTYAAGAGDLLVAASAFSDFPAPARKLPQVSDANGIHWERLIALQPDLVLVWESGTRPQDVQRLHDLKIPSLTLTVRKLADVPHAMERIGAAVGRAETARGRAAQVRAQLANVKPAPPGAAPVRVFIEISALPLMTVNGEHVLSEIVTRCGGANVFADAPTLVAEPSREALLARAPQVLLRPRQGAGSNWPDYLPRNDATLVRAFTPDWAFRPGPRLLDALQEVCAALDGTRTQPNRK